MDFYTAKFPYGEIILYGENFGQRNIRTAKIPILKFPHDEISSRRNFLNVVFSYDEKSYGEIFHRETFYGEVPAHGPMRTTNISVYNRGTKKLSDDTQRYGKTFGTT